jgi:soluble lytic murein transglycosylase-like protein
VLPVLLLALAAPAAVALPDWVDDALDKLGGGSQEGAPDPARSEELAELWDAFLTFVVKRAGIEAGDLPLRQDFLEVLLDGRYDEVTVLADAAKRALDPLRELFGPTWERLSPLLVKLADALPRDAGERYRALAAAGDALGALPGLGKAGELGLTPETLQRLARIVAPKGARDALAYDRGVDPELRELFDLGAPLPPPESNPAVDPYPDLVGWLVPAAFAAESEPPADPITALAKRLNVWVPARSEIPEYLPLVRDLLLGTAERTLAAQTLDPAFHELYRDLTLATAWQETCWRQFVKSKGVVRPIRSGVGAVGLMQINPRVWRGLYDLEGLQRDIAYNGRAGSEILRHYLVDYAIRKGEGTATGDADNLARATYAVYNGGPRHLRRYRKAETSKPLKEIDRLFLEKYQAVKAGQELAVAGCFK